MDKASFLKIALTLLLYTILIFPIVWIIGARSGRIWLQEGIEGENKRREIREVWEVIYMWIAVGSFLLIVYMIVHHTHYGIVYSREQYALAFLCTTGSNGLSALTIYLKQRNQK